MNIRLGDIGHDSFSALFWGIALAMFISWGIPWIAVQLFLKVTVGNSVVFFGLLMIAQIAAWIMALCTIVMIYSELRRYFEKPFSDGSYTIKPNPGSRTFHLFFWASALLTA